MLISIIIPCYNVQEFIASCSDSVLNQTYKNIEIIYVDDGSTDSTLNIINEYQKKNPEQIQVISQKKNGAAAARNKGLSLAKGEYIQFLDADDLLLAEKIRHQVLLVEQSLHPPDFIAGNEYWQKIDGTQVVFHQFSKNPWIDLIQGTLGDACANLWRRQSFIDIGGWNESQKSSQEAELLFRFLKNDAIFIYDDVPLTIIRQRKSGSVSMSDTRGNLIRRIMLRVEIGKYLKTKGILSDHIKNVLYDYLFISIHSLYPLDSKSSIELFFQFLPKDYSLQSGNVSYSYGFLFRIFGFSKTETIFLLLKRFL